MKEGLKHQKHPTELVGLWHSPSEGATSQPSAHWEAMYLALTCLKPKGKPWYSKAVWYPLCNVI